MDNELVKSIRQDLEESGMLPQEDDAYQVVDSVEESSEAAIRVLNPIKKTFYFVAPVILIVIIISFFLYQRVDNTNDQDKLPTIAEKDIIFTPRVLANQTKAALNINIPATYGENTIFKKVATFEDEAIFQNGITIEQGDLQIGDTVITEDTITGFNSKISGISAGTGITSTGGTNPVISNAGVLSIGGQTGAVSLTAGDGITVDGIKITNSDRGSAQNIFKTITVDSSSFDASSNTDELTFVSGSGINLSTDTTNKTITISAAVSSAAGFTDGGTDVYLTTSTDNVGLGTSTPAEKLDIVGNLRLSGNIQIGSDTIADFVGNGLEVSSNTLMVSLLNAADSTGGTSSRSGLEFGGAGSNQISLLQGCGNGELLKWNEGTGMWECSTDIGGGGGGIINVEEGDSLVSNTAATLDFLGNDFALTESPVGEVNIGIDYTNSKILRSDQAETITANWVFNAGLTFGDGGDAIAVNSNTWDISSLGVASGLTGLSSSGTISFTDLTTNGVVYTSGGNGTLNTEAQLGVTRGGTGVNGSTASNGQLLIGNGSGYTLATITAGSGISISNGSGSITISQTGSGASKWQQDNPTGTLYPNISTLDVLVGGTSTASAKFGLINNAGGTPAFFTTGNIGIGLTNPAEKLDLNTGTIRIRSFGTAGFVKNDVNGVLSGGNSITAGDIPTSDLVNGTGISMSGTLTGRLVGAGNNVTVGVSTAVPTSISNDTNVTGSISNNVLTLGWNGQLSATRGGTGINGSAASNGTLLIGNGTGYTLANLTAGTGISISNGAGSITISQTGSGASKWLQNDSTGVLTPNISTLDVLLGGSSSSSARIGFLNMATGTPTATLSAGLSGALNLAANGVISTTAMQTLTLGGSTTGNIVIDSGSSLITLADDTTVSGNLSVAGTTGFVLSGNGAGINFNHNSTHILQASSGTLQINAFTLGGTLAANTQTISGIGTASFGTGNVSINAKTVGLTSDTDLITLADNDVRVNGTLNSTSGLYTGAGAGTLRIDASGNLTINGNAVLGDALSDTISLNGTLQGASLVFEGASANGFETTLSIADPTGANTITLPNASGTIVVSAASPLSIDANGQISCASCAVAGGAGGSKWTLNGTDGTLYPNIATTDILLGSTATASAKFAFLNLAGGTPTASFAGDLVFSGARSIVSRALTRVQIGDNQTGDIFFSPARDVQFYDSQTYIDSSGNIVAKGQLTANGTGTNTLAGSLTINGNTSIGNGSGDTVTIAGNTITLSAFSNNDNSVLYVGNAGQIGVVETTSSNQCLLSTGANSAPVWGTCPTNANLVYFKDNAAGSLSQVNTTMDLLLGGSATTSAKFAFTNINSGTPTASVSAQTNNIATFLSADGTLGTTSMTNLTLGGASTGQVFIQPNGDTGDYFRFTSNGTDLTLATTDSSNLTLAPEGYLSFFTGGGEKLRVETDGDLLFEKGSNDLTIAVAAPTGSSRTATIPALSSDDSFVFADLAQTINNKTFIDSTLLFQDEGGTNRRLALQLSGISNSTTRTLTVPNANGTIAVSASSPIVLDAATGDISCPTCVTGGGAGSSKWTLSNAVIYPNTISNRVGIGTTTEANVISELFVTRPASTPIGKALAIFNQTESDDIITASASGSTVFTIANNGNIRMLESAGGTFFGTLQVGDLAANKTYVFPNFTGSSAEVCLTTGNCIGGAGGSVGGSGSENFLAKFDSSGTSIQDSLVFDNGTNVGIGTSVPLAKLDVNGGASLSGNLTFAGGTRTIGATAMNTLTIGDSNTGNIVVDSGTNITQLADGTIQLTGSNPTIAATSTNSTLSIAANGNGTLTLNNGATGNIQFFSSSNTLSSSGALTLAGSLTLDGDILDSSGNLVLNDTVDIGSAANGLRVDSTGLLIDINGDLVIQDHVLPQASNTYDLGSVSSQWRNVYAAADVIVNGSSVCLEDGTNCPAGTVTYWNQTNGALMPKISTVDFLLGGTATTSAKFAVLNMLTGTPTASISAPSTFNSLVLDASGSIRTTALQALNIGNSETGDITFNSGRNINFYSTANNITSSGNLTLAGDINLATGNYIGLLGGGNVSFTDAGTDEVEINTAILDLNNNLITNIGDANTDFTAGGGLNLAGNLDVNGTSNDIAGTLNLSGVGGLTFGTTGPITLAGGVISDGTDEVDISDDLAISGALQVGGTSALAYSRFGTSTTGHSLNASNDVLIEDDLEVDGDIFGDGALTLVGNLVVDGTVSDSGGNLVLDDTVDIGSSANGLRVDTTGLLIDINGDLVIQDHVLPQANTTFDLGSASFQWRNIYAATDVIVNGQSVCLENGTNCPAGATTYWDINANALYPRAEYAGVADLLLGSNATTSAKFAFMNVLTGTPTASISGITNFNALSLAADGVIATTARQSLTLGNTNTGVITIGNTGMAVNINNSGAGTTTIGGGTNTGTVSVGNNSGTSAIQFFNSSSGTTSFLTGSTTSGFRIANYTNNTYFQINTGFGGNPPIAAVYSFSGDGTLSTSSGVDTQSIFMDVNPDDINYFGTSTVNSEQSVISVGARTFTGSTAFTINDAASLRVEGAPIRSGTNWTLANTYALKVDAGAVGSATNSYGLFVDAQTGATNNYGAIFNSGNVGVGLTNPAHTLSVVGTTNITGAVTTGSSLTIDGDLSDSSGNLVLNDTVDLGSTANGLRVDSTGLLIDINGDLIVQDHILPQADNTFDLGSGSFQWRNIYAETDVIVNGQSVCLENGTNCPAGTTTYWDLNANAIYPKAEYASVADLLLGSNATASAKFAFMNVLTGTPTASIAGTTTNQALFLTGNGNIATTAMKDLTLGGSTTGTVSITPGAGLGLNVNLSGAGDFAVNTNQLYVDTSTGNVGIGVTNPDNKLQIYGTSGPIRTRIQNTGTTSSDIASVILDRGGVNGWASISYYNATTNLFGTGLQSGLTGFSIWDAANGNATRFYIQSSATGNVGIATTSPLAQLDVNGNASVSGNLTFSGARTIAASAMASLNIGDGSTGDLTLNSGRDIRFFSSANSLTSAGNLTIAGVFTLNGDITDSSGNLVLADTVDIGSAANGINIDTNGIISDSDGNVVLNDTVDLGSAANGLRVDSAGLLIDINGDLIVQDHILPQADNTFDLGSGSFQWRNIYAEADVIVNGQSVCLEDGTNCPAGAVTYWNQTNGALMPKISTVDVLFGGTSSTSAKFAFLNNVSGTPTASIAAQANNQALYLTADGSIGTTARTNLTLGNSSTYNTTGNILLNPNGTGYVGIGTSTPSRMLQLQSPNSGQSNFIVNTTGVSGQFEITGSLAVDHQVSTQTGTGYTMIANSLTTGTGLSISSSSTDGGTSGNTKLINLSRTGANSNASHTAYGLYSSVANTGTTSTNIAGFFEAIGATTSYGLQVAAMTSATSTGLSIGNLSGGTANSGITIGTLSGTGTGTGLQIGAISTTGTSSRGIVLGTLTGGSVSNLQISTGAITGTSGSVSNTQLVLGGISGTANASSTNLGIQVGNISVTGSTNYGINLGTLTGGSTSNYQINTGALTGISSATNAQLNLAGISGAGGSSNNYGINIGSITSTGTANYGIRVGAISGAATTNYGLYIDSVSGGTTNYALYSAGGTNYFAGNVGIGNTAPLAALDVTGSASISANLSLRGTTTAHTFDILDGGSLNFRNSAGGPAGVNTSTLFIRANGNIGVGTTTPGTAFDVVGSNTTTTTVGVTANSLTTGKILSVSTFSPSLSSGDVSYIDEFGQYASNVTRSGNTLEVRRYPDISGGGNTLNITGPMVDFNDTCTTSSGGTCTSSGDVLRITQDYASNTGVALNVDFGGADAGYALRINDDGTVTDSTPFAITGTGNVGIGITNPSHNLSVVGTTNITGAVTTGSSLTIDGDLSDSSGNLVLNDTVDIGSSANGLRVDSAGLLIDINGDFIVQDHILPQADNTFDLGSSSFQWRNIYAETDVIVNGQSVCLEDGTNCPAGTVTYWNQTNGALMPKISTVDVLFGGTATDTAKFAFLNNVAGTPTASIAGTTTNQATFLTGTGNLGTTAMNNLTLGGSSTGNIFLLPRNSTGSVGINTTAPLNGLDVFTNNGNSTLTNISNNANTGTISVSSTYTTGNYVPLLNWYTTDNNATKSKVALVGIGDDSFGSGLYIMTSDSYSTGASRIGAAFCANGKVGLGTVCDPQNSISLGVGSQTINDFMSFGNPTQTLTGASYGFVQNFSGITATGQNFTGQNLTLPAVTNTGAGSTAYKGFIVTGGNLTHSSGGGTDAFTGLQITNGNITQTAGTVTATGALITTGSITTGGTQTGLSIAASGVGAGTLTGISISGITGSTGTETALSIGGGWDTGIDLNANILVNIGNSGTDFTSAGGLTLAGDLTSNANTVIGNANTDTLTINAGSSGSGITFGDSSFANCTLTTVGGALTCGAGGSGSNWNTVNGTIQPKILTQDLLLGGSATTSAKFAFINNLTGTPTASISANNGNNALFISGDGTIATTNKQDITIGDANSGNLILKSLGSVVFSAVPARDTIFIGVNAGSTGLHTVAIGRDAGTADTVGDNVFIGYQAGLGTNTTYNVAVGYGAGSVITSGGSNTFLGYNADANASNLNNVIVLGRDGLATASNQFVVGSENAPITNAYIGEGVTSTTPGNIAINATGGSGSNIAGGSLVLAGGRATGNATGGSIIFQTSDVGASGSTLRTLSEKMRIDSWGRVGLGTTTPNGFLTVSANGMNNGLAIFNQTGTQTYDDILTASASGTTKFVIGNDGKIGINGVQSSSDYLVNVDSDNTSDFSRVFNITHANNAGEDNSVIKITNTTSGNPGLSSLEYYNLDLSLAASGTSSNPARPINAFGVNNVVDVSSLTASAGIINARGENVSITGTHSITNSSGAVYIDGVYSSVATTLNDNGNDIDDYYTYAGRFINSSVSNMTDAGSILSYGIYAATSGNLDASTALPAHYAGYFSAGGTATNNYGVYIADTTGGSSNNYALYSAGTDDINYFAGQIGVGTSPTAGYQLDIASTSSLDWDRVINITHANDANEDSSVIQVANTVNQSVQDVTRVIANANLSFAPTLSLSESTGSTSLTTYGINQNFVPSSITLGNRNGGSINANIYGVRNVIQNGNLIFNGSGAGSTNVTEYGSYNAVADSLTLTSVPSSTFYTAYAGYFNANSSSGGNANLNASLYGAYITSQGNLTTTGTTTHYGGYIDVQGTADNNYGLYIADVQSATNNYALYSAGADDISYFAGNVGIGTSTPTNFALQVAGNIGPNADITYDLGATSSARFRSAYLGPGSLHIQCTTGDGCGQTLDYAIGVNTATNNLYIGSNGRSGALHSLFNINGETGNVGIGTTAPAGALHVTTSNASFIPLFERTGTATNTRLFTNRYLATSSNDMTDGFGASTVFSIKDNAGVTNDIAQIAAVRNGNDTSGALTFITYNTGTITEQARITATGAFGIGTTVPIGGLQVSKNGTNNAIGIFNQMGTESFDDIFTASSSGTTRFVIRNDGNVGIGTTNAIEKLTVSGNASVSGYLTVGQAGGIRSEFGNLNFQYKSGGNAWTTGMVLSDVNGYVGIGNTAPQYQLDLLSTAATQLRLGYDTSNYFTTAISSAGLVTFNAVGGSAGFNFLDGIYLGTAGSLDGSITFNSSGVGETAPSISSNNTGNLIITAPSGIVDIGNGIGDIQLDPGGSNIVANLSSTGDFLIQDNGTTFVIFTDSGNVGIGTTAPTRLLDVNGTGKFSGNGKNNAIAIFNQTDSTATPNIITASASGTTKFNLTYGGALQLAGGQTSDIDTLTGTTLKIGASTANQITLGRSGQTLLLGGYTNGGSGCGILTTDSSGVLTCGSAPATAPNWWTLSSGTLQPINNTMDLLWGGTATSSAKFGFLNTLTGTPTASIAGTTQGAFYMTGDGKLATTNKKDITLGDSTTTGNIIVNPSGNIGVGLTSPASKLSVAGVTDTSGNFTLEYGTISSHPLTFMSTYGGSGGALPGIAWGTTDNNATKPKVAIWANADGTGSDLYFGTSNSYASGITSIGMSINERGNVGIGTGTTNPGRLLDVAGTGRFSGNGTNNAIAIFNQSGTQTNDDILVASSSGTTRFRIDNAGNVGIGTTSNIEKLTISGNASASGYLTVGQAGGIRSEFGNLNFQYKSGGNAWTTGMVLSDVNGYLGLGTTAPLYLFDVQGSKSDYLARFYNSSTNAAAAGMYLRVDGNGNLLTLNNNGTDVFTISGQQAVFNVPTQFNAAGDVSMAYDLVFTNPTASYIDSAAPLYIRAGEVFNSSNLTLQTYNVGNIVLDAGGGSIIQGAQYTGNAALIVNQLGSSGLFTASASGTTKFLIDNYGRIAAGTTTPKGLLEITGNGLNNALAIFNQTGSQTNDYLFTASQAGTTKFVINNSGNVGIGPVSPSALFSVGTSTASNFMVNSSGDVTGAITTLNGSTTASNTESSSTGLDVASSTNFDVGNYVLVNSTYAKITAVSAGLLTISPALSWSSGATVTEVHIPEIGATNTASTLANRFGRGYFIDGIVTGNASTYYTDTGITTSNSSFDIATTNATTINLGTSATTVNIGATGATITSSGGFKIGARSDSTSAFSRVNSAAGTFGQGTSIDNAYAITSYNGSIYVGTAEAWDGSAGAAEVYRYDTGSTFTRVSQSSAGTIAEDGGSTTGIDEIESMIVYNGYMYVGTYDNGGSGGRAEVYRYDGSANWTKVSQSTAGTIAASGRANIDGVPVMAVHNGQLYIGTEDSNGAQIYRYDGGTTWTAINTTAGTFGLATNVDKINSMASYNGQLYVGIRESNSARILRWDGQNTWTIVSDATAGKITSTGTSSIDGVASLISYGGSLYAGTDEGISAEVYRYEGTATQSAWMKVSGTAGQICGAANSASQIYTLTNYNGSLYAGTTGTNTADVCRYDGGTTWTRVSNGAGQISSNGTTGVDAVQKMVSHNGSLYAAVGEEGSTANAELHVYTAYEGQSYALQFNAASDNANAEQNGNLNLGSITFLGELQTYGAAGEDNTGSFLFSHGITSAFGAYDIAEDYPTRDDSLTAGDLVSIDENEGEFVKKAEGSASKVVGIFSEKPGFRLSQKDQSVNGGRMIPVALAGRVPVKVAPDSSEIKAGDMLTLSRTNPGMATKAIEPGYIIGKAIENYNPSKGKVMVFVTFTWFDPNINFAENGDIQFQKSPDGSSWFALNDSGDILGKKDAFSDLFVANLKAGKVEAQDIYGVDLVATNGTFENLSATFLNTETLNIADTISAGRVTTDEIEMADFRIVPNGDTLAISTASGAASITFKSNGDITTPGTITAKAVKAQNGEFSDTLRVKTLIVDNIEGLTASSSAIFNLGNGVKATFGEFDFGKINTDLTVLGTTTLKDAVVQETVKVGGEMVLTQNSVDTITQPLEIQSLKQQEVRIMAGAVTFKTDGTVKFAENVEFAKDVKVGGVLSARAIQVAKSMTQIFSNTEVQASGSAGTTYIKSGETMRTVFTDEVKPGSLIYITPLSDTLGETPFIGEQMDINSTDSAHFTVKIKSPVTKDIKFNYLIIGQK